MLVLFILLSTLISSVYTCQSDDIVFRMWQPLPPVILDEAGNPLEGLKECGNFPDQTQCWAEGCIADDKVEANDTKRCSDYFCWKGFCLNSVEREKYVVIPFGNQTETNSTLVGTTQASDNNATTTDPLNSLFDQLQADEGAFVDLPIIMIEVDNVDDHINETESSTSEISSESSPASSISPTSSSLETRRVVEESKVANVSPEVIKVPGANSSFMFQQFQHGRRT
ncbi:uncharacterized protein LOC111709977 [Eurytemora carolleeae]|uniref:uncharacterized protein LOC111709977 n=1 Tax=Eurytemora carolleeae TaxID=1294199 RepID=UPI000C770069|nr:uncharacterized protein LOC111709977 [Eurytemora carolleeae]XP_023339728.1 uncharacterized protein LOC111709977 [Eurytemora carolleeae]|eukprot:XP_023339727.1 uncharacterized protein LOC111709977 [Eurytemora affinis]